MVFFGGVVRADKELRIPETSGEIFHLSQACMNNPKTTNKTYLRVTDENGTYNVCSLAKDRCEHASFDIFIPVTAEAKFTVSGPEEVHVTGYFEPDQNEDMHFDADDEDADSDVEIGDEGEVDKAELLRSAAGLSGKKMSALLPGTAQKRGNKIAETEAQESDESEDGDDEGSIEMTKKAVAKLLQNNQDGAGSDHSNSDDEEDDDVDAEAVFAAVEAAKKKPKVAFEKAPRPQVAVVPANKKEVTKQPQQPSLKRKAETAPATPQSPPAKKQKGAAGATAGTTGGKSEEDQYVEKLVQHLKTAGRTPISSLGSTVKKPLNLKKKLGQLIRERKEFVVEGAFVKCAA